MQRWAGWEGWRPGGYLGFGRKLHGGHLLGGGSGILRHSFPLCPNLSTQFEKAA